MTPIDLTLALAAFGATASVGIVVHEFAHALTLRCFGIPYRMEWLPRDGGQPLRSVAIGAFARVTPIALPPGCPAWRLRVAAMAPLLLLAPFALVPTGIVADPFSAGPMVAMAAAGWLACALPSPSDFSLLWQAERAIELHAAREPAAEESS